MRIKSMVRLATPVAVLMMAASVLVATPTTALAATGGCYGASCNGRDPMGLCDGDAITVGAMNVDEGVLELRYSSSCAANWGRYTPYNRDAWYWASQNIGIWVQISSWNPGLPSYGTAHHDNGVAGSSWSQMTDGRGVACTGAHVYHSHPNGDLEWLSWNQGPCY